MASSLYTTYTILYNNSLDSASSSDSDAIRGFMMLSRNFPNTIPTCIYDYLYSKSYI